MGSPVEVRLYKPLNGSKTCLGTLKGYADGAVRVESGGTEYVFEKSQVAKVRLRIV